MALIFSIIVQLLDIKFSFFCEKKFHLLYITFRTYISLFYVFGSVTVVYTSSVCLSLWIHVMNQNYLRSWRLSLELLFIWRKKLLGVLTEVGLKTEDRFFGFDLCCAGLRWVRNDEEVSLKTDFTEFYIIWDLKGGFCTTKNLLLQSFNKKIWPELVFISKINCSFRMSRIKATLQFGDCRLKKWRTFETFLP